ncbi:MAG: hypothetical protein J3K34DRAFT_421030 [Monoraphidium minutum]|nr:MAG: hypothetical protein J3K34DRAFT_421030 [Monoraphidium minutum]
MLALLSWCSTAILCVLTALRCRGVFCCKTNGLMVSNRHCQALCRVEYSVCCQLCAGRLGAGHAMSHMCTAGVAPQAPRAPLLGPARPPSKG